jgi:hypothetical protein
MGFAAKESISAHRCKTGKNCFLNFYPSELLLLLLLLLLLFSLPRP